MVRARGTPVEQVRHFVERSAGRAAAAQVPERYHRVGSVVLLRIPESARPNFGAIGDGFREVLGVETVLRHAGPAAGERRIPDLERIAGSSTETEITEHGVRYRFDAATTMFSRGNAAERARAGTATKPDETIVDLFAGVGYFVVPALRMGKAARAYAVEENPSSYRYLVENLRLNEVEDRAVALLGDNRVVDLPVRNADRILLGFLPSAVPWIPRALSLARDGATLHVHLVVDARDDRAVATRQVTSAVQSAGGAVQAAAARRVKAYGPGRSHVVVDTVVTPRAA